MNDFWLRFQYNLLCLDEEYPEHKKASVLLFDLSVENKIALTQPQSMKYTIRLFLGRNGSQRLRGFCCCNDRLSL